MENMIATILIVDDEPKNIFSLEQFLVAKNWQLLTASNGKDALAFALNRTIDLIVMDVHMPEMDGFEVAQVLKSNKRTRDIPIIFISAKMLDSFFILRGFEEGAVDYLSHPLDPKITKAKVSALLQLHLQKKELAEKNLALEKYALLINNSSDLIAIVHPKTLHIIEINDAVNNLLGYTPADMRDTSLLQYLSKEDEALIKRFQKESKERFSFISRIYTIKGELKWVDWNIIHRNGLWLTNARDISDLKETEEIRNYLAAVVKQSDEAIYLHNAAGEIISWNKGAEKMYGFSEAEALQMKAWNIVPVHLMKETQALIGDILNGKKVEAQRTNRITKYGQVKDVILSASVISGSDGSFKSVAITERDITAQKKAEQEILLLNENLNKNLADLEIINKELQSFSYSISHDLRNPLTNIIGLAKALEESYQHQLNEDGNEILSMLLDSARRMDGLITALLEFSKLGTKRVVKAPVEFDVLITRVLKDFKTAIEDKVNITILPLLPSEGDYMLLYQVFANLISNAIKYSSKKPSPKIEIGSYEKGNQVVYYVKDNGAGFDMTYAGKLFGVFQRLHHEKDFKGTGIGLATVQRIINKHDGTIWAEGKVEEGATFYFSLPKVQK